MVVWVKLPILCFLPYIIRMSSCDKNFHLIFYVQEFCEEAHLDCRIPIGFIIEIQDFLSFSVWPFLWIKRMSTWCHFLWIQEALLFQHIQSTYSDCSLVVWSRISRNIWKKTSSMTARQKKSDNIVVSPKVGINTRGRMSNVNDMASLETNHTTVPRGIFLTFMLQIWR